MTKNQPAWWPTPEQKRHADAGCAHPDECKVPAAEPTPATTHLFAQPGDVVGPGFKAATRKGKRA